MIRSIDLLYRCLSAQKRFSLYIYKNLCIYLRTNRPGDRFLLIKLFLASKNTILYGNISALASWDSRAFHDKRLPRRPRGWYISKSVLVSPGSKALAGRDTKNLPYVPPASVDVNEKKGLRLYKLDVGFVYLERRYIGKSMFG